MAGIRSRKGKHEVMWYDADGRQRSKTFPGETSREELETFHHARLEETRQRKAGSDPVADAVRQLASVRALLVKALDDIQAAEHSLKR